MTAFLWTLFWQTLVVAIAAAAAAWLVRGQPAAARHGIFFGALVVAVLLPAGSAWLHFTLVRASDPATAAVTMTASPVPRMGAATSGAPVGAPWRYPSLGVVLGCLWGGAMLLQAAGLARRSWRARLAWRQASPEREVDGVPVLRGTQGPFTLGWLRPRIVLPGALLEQAAWTEAALAHELAHVRRRDYLWAWLAELALVPLAWHPAARWLAAQAALAREAACDEAALAANAAYPTHLVDIATALHAAAATHAGLCLARRRGLEQRIAWLTAAAPRRSRARMAVAAGTLGLAVTAAWALGGGVRRVAAPEAPAAAAARQQAPAPIPVGGKVTSALCESCPAPAYPPEAKATAIQGTVEMHALIGTDGSVTALNCGVGDPTLLAAAEAAIRDWRYHPLLLNGQPETVSTTITVDFALAGGSTPPVEGLSGVVCDLQGARVPGAIVTATDTTTQAASQTRTGPDGSFLLDLPDGQYEVAVASQGFRVSRQRAMLPLRNPLLVLLNLGDASQTVLVRQHPPRR